MRALGSIYLPKMSPDNSSLLPFNERVRQQELHRLEARVKELERDNSELRAKYVKALELLRAYKNQAQLVPASQHGSDMRNSDNPEAIPKDKVTSMWRDRLLRMNSISPRKEHPKKEDKPPDIFELAEALNSGEIRLEEPQIKAEHYHEKQADISPFRAA
jgi:hypothetical protein